MWNTYDPSIIIWRTDKGRLQGAQNHFEISPIALSIRLACLPGSTSSRIIFPAKTVASVALLSAISCKATSEATWISFKARRRSSLATCFASATIASACFWAFCLASLRIRRTSASESDNLWLYCSNSSLASALLFSAAASQSRAVCSLLSNALMMGPKAKYQRTNRRIAKTTAVQIAKSVCQASGSKPPSSDDSVAKTRPEEVLQKWLPLK